MVSVVRFTLRERWESKVSPEPNSGCWLWTGALDGHGYGQLAMSVGKKKLATHVSLELVGKPRPFPEACARHKCDNPICVNPDHLEWGTMKANTQESIARGRADMSGLALGHAAMRERYNLRPVKTCETCGCTFRPRWQQVRKNKHFFCSQACSLTWQKATYTGQPLASWSGR